MFCLALRFPLLCVRIAHPNEIVAVGMWLMTNSQDGLVLQVGKI